MNCGQSMKDRAVLVFKNYRGHHMGFAVPIIDFLVGRGVDVDVIVTQQGLETARRALGDLGVRSFSGIRTSKIPFWSGFVLFWFFLKNYSGYRYIVFPTFDEWLVDFPFLIPFKSKVIGFAHYIEKSGGGAFRQLYNRISRLGIKCFLGSRKIYPLTQDLKNNYGLGNDVINYFHDIKSSVHANAVLDGYYLIFGTVRKNKNVSDFVRLLKNAKGSASIKIVGFCDEEDYREALEKDIDDLGPLVKVDFINSFTSEQEKKELYANAFAVIITASSQDYQGKMISGVLLDAVTECKPVFAPHEFYVPDDMSSFVFKYKDVDFRQWGDFVRGVDYSLLRKYKSDLSMRFRKDLEVAFDF